MSKYVGRVMLPSSQDYHRDLGSDQLTGKMGQL
jgi:hypothetical protein